MSDQEEPKAKYVDNKFHIDSYKREIMTRWKRNHQVPPVGEYFIRKPKVFRRKILREPHTLPMGALHIAATFIQVSADGTLKYFERLFTFFLIFFYETFSCCAAEPVATIPG